MKYALVQGQRRGAQPRLSGECPICGSAMTPKCGPLKVWHWAHRSICSCDSWWEPESLWHRAWKNQFPAAWQEVVHESDDGEKHVADVKTSKGVVLEFQHSRLSLHERAAREAFYRKMVWVVHGRARDKAKLSQGVVMSFGQPPIYLVRSDACALLRTWGDAGVPVYLDFGDGEPYLWRFSRRRSNGVALIMPVGKALFIAEYVAGRPFEKACAAYIEQTLSRMMRIREPRPLGGFERYLAKKRRARRHF